MALLAADVMQFYGHVMGDFPYATLNVAMLEQRLPGGHSPAYMAAVNFVSPRSTLTWKGDPAFVDGFPEYFVAHELAHQWWGQAVGWKNYHEQWLSEGFAQYFAALYAEHAHGHALYEDIIRRWQKWAVEKSDQGAVYLGYRVGHIKGDSRVFRAIVYNKGAVVLHMLRRLLGDDAFFRGLRRFYDDARFKKAGTDDLRRAFEAEAHLSLERFFDVWIYGDTLPRVRAVTYTDTVGSHDELVLTLEQAGAVFDLPVTVTLDYVGRPAAEVTVRLDQARQQFRIPLTARIRRADVDRSRLVPFSGLVVSGSSAVPASAARGVHPR
jgi:aminopeptidase N